MEISGTVVESSGGRGVSGAVVSLVAVGSGKEGKAAFAGSACGTANGYVATTQTGSDGRFVFRVDCPVQKGEELALVVEQPRLLFGEAKLIEKDDPAERILQVMQITVGSAGATGLRVPVDVRRAKAARLVPEGYAAESVAMLESAWENQDQLMKLISPKAKSRFGSNLEPKHRARTKLEKLSNAPKSLRDSGLLADEADPSKARETAKAHSTRWMNAYASLPRAVAQLWIDPPELRRRLGSDLPASGGIPLTGSICDLLRTEKGHGLERIRSLLDDPDLPTADDTPPSGPRDGGSLAVPSTFDEAMERAVRQRVDSLVSNEAHPLPIDGLRRLSESVASFALPSGPADEDTYHDFYSLQIAFEHVWVQAFDRSVRSDAEDLYATVVRLHEDYGLETSWIGEIDDVESLRAFLDETDRRRRSLPLSEPPMDILAEWPSLKYSEWNALSCQQQASLRLCVLGIQRARTDAQREELRSQGQRIIASPDGGLLRVEKLILRLRERLTQPHAFHYFAPNSVNYGILLTYRQRWAPEAYQVGRLVSTIPLAPAQTQKIRVEHKVSRTRAEQELRSSLSAFRDSTEEGRRAESEIVRRAQTVTNFQQTVQGSMNFGIGQIGGSSLFGLNQANESARTKRDFRQAVRAASQEFRDQRQLDVKTTDANESTSERIKEISNPNDEISVTYLLYELERRYRVSEMLHRLTPVVLVAQEVPAPHEIDDAWLITHEWVLRRVILDDRFRKALDLLTEGFVGDEAGVEVARQAWDLQKSVVDELKSNHARLQAAHEALEQRLVDTMMGQADAAAGEPDEVAIAAAAFATGGWSLLFGEGDSRSERFEAMRKALELRAEQLQRSLAQAKSDLRAEASVLEKAQAEYTEALRKQMDRRTLVDQLRVHVKDNILHYMQAIWDHEPTDQRFFRLYHVEVPVPQPPPGGCVLRRATPEEVERGNVIRRHGELWVMSCAAPSMDEVEVRPLGQLADLDRPLGFKGNYIIYPLRECVYLTDFMMQEYVDDYMGIRDPDSLGEFPTSELVEFRKRADSALQPEERAALDRLLARRLTVPSGEDERVIVPTGQLMMEVLPGEHPVLERFKRLHRAVDLVKVENEVRLAELEALRYAARLRAGEIGDPQTDSHIVVQGGDVTVTPEL
jgi:hypothetical protein